MQIRLEENTTLRRSQKQLFTDIDGEIAMLSIQNGEYYYFNEAGSYIWATLVEPKTYSTVINELVSEFNVDVNTCFSETKPYIEELIKLGIIEASNS